MSLADGVASFFSINKNGRIGQSYNTVRSILYYWSETRTAETTTI